MVKDFHVNDGPFLKSNNSTNKIMRNLLFALLPIIAFAFLKNGIIPYINNKTNIVGMLYPLIFIVIPIITSFVMELLYAVLIKKKRNKELTKYINTSYSIFPGLFLGLILPINTPISILIFGAIIATIIGKLIYGGFGNNIFNPALIGRLFVITIYASVISSNGGYLNSYEVDAISTSTPLSNSSIIEGVGSYETLVQPYGSLLNFFIGTIPGAVGETSSLLCVIAFIYLAVTGTIKWKIPLIYILTVFGITGIIGGINGLGIWYPLFQILSGGLMFGAVFMATDPVTSPVTPIGQVLYGLLLGILTVLFRFLTPYPEGVLTSILTMNMFVVILDRMGSTSRFNFKKILLPLILIFIVIMSCGFGIGYKYLNDNNVTDTNYDIISKEKSDNKVEYIVTQKGYSSNIKASIIIEDGEITEFKILEQNESFYSKIEKSNYINKLIDNQTTLDNVDTISGATVTSSALKKLLTNTIKDYTKDGGTLVGIDPDFNIVSKERLENKIVYLVTEKSFNGEIKLRITFNHGVIETITVVEQSDSYFDLIIDSNYITKLIENQQVLNGLDTVSGATISSNSLKKAIENTRRDYARTYEEQKN